MNIVIVASKTCRHHPILQRQIQDLGLSCTIQYIEEHPELIGKYGIRSSPNIVVDDELIFQGKPGKSLPSSSELKECFGIQ